MLSLWMTEKFFLYREIPEICSELHISQPKISDVLEALRNAGYEAYRTHFSPQGIRTDAPDDALRDILLSLANG